MLVRSLLQGLCVSNCWGEQRILLGTGVGVRASSEAGSGPEAFSTGLLLDLELLRALGWVMDHEQKPAKAC